jgi:hypothetical protein
LLALDNQSDATIDDVEVRIESCLPNFDELPAVNRLPSPIQEIADRAPWQTKFVLQPGARRLFKVAEHEGPSRDPHEIKLCFATEYADTPHAVLPEEWLYPTEPIAWAEYEDSSQGQMSDYNVPGYRPRARGPRGERPVRYKLRIRATGRDTQPVELDCMLTTDPFYLILREWREDDTPSDIY